MSDNRKKLHQLFFPIFFEILFSILAGAVDTLMLSSEGDQAVGAVGTANTYISIFVIMFSIISSGMVAVMTQYIGAKRPGVARQALRLGVCFNLAAGVFISGFLFFCAEPILQTVGIAAQLLPGAKTYLKTVGLFCVCNALVPIFSSYLRAFGHTAPTMAATLTANLVNVALNALFLFVLHWGVFGVALATGISRLVNLLWVCIAARRRIRPVQENNLPRNREIFGKIIRVGLPAAMETILYNLAITIVISLLNGMDETGMQATARAYAQQIANFSFCAGAALAQANAIMVGWRIGAGETVRPGHPSGRPDRHRPGRGRRQRLRPLRPAHPGAVHRRPGDGKAGGDAAGGGHLPGDRPHGQPGLRLRPENQRRRGVSDGHRRGLRLPLRRRRHLALRRPPRLAGGGCLCGHGPGRMRPGGVHVPALEKGLLENHIPGQGKILTTYILFAAPLGRHHPHQS